MFEEGFTNGEVMRTGMLRLVADYVSFKESRTVPRPEQPPPGNSWHPPLPSCVKINVDAGSINGVVRLGAVCRSHSGAILFVATKSLVGNVSVQLAESLAVRWGLQLGCRLGYSSCIIESDCLSIINKLNRGESGRSYVDLVVTDVLGMVDCFQNASYSFVKRAENIVAHFAARLNVIESQEKVYCSNFPQGILILAGIDN